MQFNILRFPIYLNIADTAIDILGDASVDLFYTEGHHGVKGKRLVTEVRGCSLVPAVSPGSLLETKNI
jgi:hypothetical protein